MHPKKILHIDDDYDDKELIGEAFLDANPTLQLQQFCSAKEGLSYLQQAKQQGILPDLILLDINMPGMDGKQAAKIIKSDKVLSTIPLALFTTSILSEDRQFFNELGASMFIKPSNMRDLHQNVQEILKTYFS